MTQQLLECSLDVEVMQLGDRLPVEVGPQMRAVGWRGGQFVRYIPPQGVADWMVENSDGNEVAGYLIFSSSEYGNFMQGGGGNYAGSLENYISRQSREEGSWPAGTGVMTMMIGGGRMIFRVFETIALVGAGTRTGPAIVYGLNDNLKVSENGLLCNDSDVNLNAAGIANPVAVGSCCLVPAVTNQTRLGIDYRF